MQLYKTVGISLQSGVFSLKYFKKWLIVAVFFAFFSQDHLGLFLAKFIQANKSGYRKLNKPKSIEYLLAQRIKYLEETINDFVVSWAMKGSIGGHELFRWYIRIS